MMKVKAVKPIPSSNSYKGLDPNDWRNLNAGEAVEIESIPATAKEFLQEIKSKKDKE